MISKKIKEHQEFLTECGNHFVLTPEDLSNLYDLSYMVNWQDYNGVLKPNKMDKWFRKFFDRLEEVCLAEKEDYSKIIMKQKSEKESYKKGKEALSRLRRRN
jgi:hypothetical protein